MAEELIASQQETENENSTKNVDVLEQGGHKELQNIAQGSYQVAVRNVEQINKAQANRQFYKEQFGVDIPYLDMTQYLTPDLTFEQLKRFKEDKREYATFHGIVPLIPKSPESQHKNTEFIKLLVEQIINSALLDHTLGREGGKKTIEDAIILCERKLFKEPGGFYVTPVTNSWGSNSVYLTNPRNKTTVFYFNEHLLDLITPKDHTDKDEKALNFRTGSRAEHFQEGASPHKLLESLRSGIISFPKLNTCLGIKMYVPVILDREKGKLFIGPVPDEVIDLCSFNDGEIADNNILVKSVSDVSGRIYDLKIEDVNSGERYPIVLPIQKILPSIVSGIIEYGLFGMINKVAVPNENGKFRLYDGTGNEIDVNRKDKQADHEEFVNKEYAQILENGNWNELQDYRIRTGVECKLPGDIIQKGYLTGLEREYEGLNPNFQEEYKKKILYSLLKSYYKFTKIPPSVDTINKIIAKYPFMAEFLEENFSTREYINVSFTCEKLDEILNNPQYTPEDILNLFNSDFKDIFNSSIGVWEGYSLREHTLMVMKQFRKYFKGKPLPANIEEKKIEIILALHDIGKPRAISEKNKNKAYEYTSDIIEKVLSKLAFSREQIVLSTALINGDPIGSYLKGGNITESAKKIINMAKSSGIQAKDFWQLLKIYYLVDAGSYTEDAGGKKSLDRLFSFDHDSKTMAFAPQVDIKINELEKEIDKIMAIS
ncbi:MAG: Uncharacterized protein CEN89_539 [Candidatus Berkelbacteria bacterium Licking1014_7]|uniref:HD domain-containing protein n=1 Tax=Candidatus Berkelbacteria bacterium Licking1014_7 TaxID=2017147 RepID=A0A554LIJ5_9BACT|nr:MAG: Uncharacterized protein CEN89_539 [Candidatus Berkelbacteria bacterium Licking1014_7]